MPGGSWNTDSPPILPGTYFNFIASLQAAISSGITGVAAIIGTGDWGPAGSVTSIQSQGELGQVFGEGTGGTLDDGVLAALDGFDSGGASQVLAIRTIGAGAVAATVTLDDTPAADALRLTAKYPGIRANSWHTRVQTNPVNATNKDLILYEAGVELQRWENVNLGHNDDFATAINASLSPYVTATAVGAADRALVNIVGTVGGAGGFGVAGGGVAGTNGAAIGATEITAALNLLNEYDFQSVALSDISDDTMLDVFTTWVEDRNEAGQRFFAVIGGPAAEPLLGVAPSAQARSVEYDNPGTSSGQRALNLVNIGGFDLTRIADGVTIPPMSIAPRLAGVIATLGLTRSLTGLRWTGYQVKAPLSLASQIASVGVGVLTFENEGIGRVSILEDVTALLSTNTLEVDPRPAPHKKVRNVAVDHFIQNTLDEVVRNSYKGTLPNNPTGRRDLASSFLGFLQGLEEQGLLESGASTVELDLNFVQGGNAVFLKGEYVYQGFVERIMTNFRVRA